jgi:uncharacterized protein involved in cysteine biosynthesis
MNVSAMGSEKKRVLVDIGGGGVVGRVFGGAKASFSGVGLVFTDPKLLSLAFVPMLVHVGLFALFLWLSFSQLAAPLVDWLSPEQAASGFWASLLSGIIHVVVAVVVVLASLVATVMAGSVACDPFYDLLSERTEEIFIGRNAGLPFSVGNVARGVGREAVATVLRLLVWGAVALPLWALSFTPASLLATPLSFVWTWLFFAYEYLSRSLARHAVEPKHRFKPIFDHKAIAVGFGATAWLVSFVPFLAPLLVVAATRLYLSLAAWDRVPSKLTAEEKQQLKA